MNSKREIRDPHLRAFADQAGNAFEESFAEFDLSLPDGPELSFAAMLGLLVPRPVLREALDLADA